MAFQPIALGRKEREADDEEIATRPDGRRPGDDGALWAELGTRIDFKDGSIPDPGAFSHELLGGR